MDLGQQRSLHFADELHSDNSDSCHIGVGSRSITKYTIQEAEKTEIRATAHSHTQCWLLERVTSSAEAVRLHGIASSKSSLCLCFPPFGRKSHRLKLQSELKSA